MDSVVKIPVGDVWCEFLNRDESGYDTTVNDDIVVKEIFVENVYRVYTGDLADTGIVVDIGGNVGAFSIYCAALGAKAVYAFEPDSFNWDRLLINIEHNNFGDIIHPTKRGVSNVEGERELINGQGASFITDTKTVIDPVAMARIADAPSELVELISLASVFADNEISSCDILKIDCEGSEYDLFEGAPSDIIAKAKYITMEFHGTDDVAFGKMIAKLTLTHNIHIIGRSNYGGQIYARRY